MIQKIIITLLGSLTFYASYCQENKSITKQLEQKYGSAYFNSEDGGYYIVGGSSFFGYYPGKPGLCDKYGKEVIAPGIYDKIYKHTFDKTQTHEDTQTYYYEIVLDNKRGIINTTGRVIIAPEKYTLIGGYVAPNGYKFFRVRISDNMGICNIDGNEIIPPVFSYIGYDNDAHMPLFKVEQNSLVGLYTLYGDVFIPANYTRISYSKLYDHYETESGEYRGIYDVSGKELIPAKYSYIHKNVFNEYEVRNGLSCGLFDVNGNEIVPPIYDKVWRSNKAPYIKVQKRGQQGIVDIQGNAIIPIIYDEVNQKDIIDSEYCRVKANGKWGIYGKDGTQLMPCEYDSILLPTEGLVGVLSKGKWGYIELSSNKLIIPYEYDAATQFADNVARVKKLDKTILIQNPLVSNSASLNVPRIKGRAASIYPAPNSDVDTNIPQGATASKHTFAFIVANENYPVAKVPYALNDGWIFERYCKQTLGIPDEHVKIFEDATGGNLITCIEQIKDIAKAYEGDASIIFYYAGHAFPDEEKSTAYLLPIDGDSKNPATGYSLEKLYSELNSVPTKSVICFLDACFSGATRDDEMLLTGRGVAIKVRDEIPQGNMIVFTSATGAETAHQFEEKGHGLFTYYLLQKLQESRGDITLGELAEYIRKMVRRKSVLINQKMQTPTVIPSPAISENWQSLKL